MKLGVYSGLDPRLATTWSGTPANLIGALEKDGDPLPCYHAEPAAGRGLPATILNKVSPASALFSKVGSRHLVDNLARHFHRQGCDTVLHISGEHLPHPGCNTGLRHLVFTDSTFEQFLMPWFRERYGDRSRTANVLLDIEMRRRNRYYRNSLSSIEHFFVTTDWVKHSLVNRYGVAGNRITTCYTGTGAISRMETARDFSHPKILFVARHNYINKGAGILLEAFRMIREKHPHAELILVGPDRAGLEMLESEEKVTIHSFLDWQELERLFNRATLFAMPSLYEPYGLVYLEAMKCGTPVVCSSTGGMSSIVSAQNCGWILEDRHPRVLANILDTVLSSPDDCESKGRNGQNFVEANCSWTKCAKVINNYLTVC
ncbi:MAG: glycosyltransferase family 4 protein [Verrucomicrobiota bacterium]